MRIAMVAGEASGDLLASQLIQAIRRVRPDVEFFGIGGPKMEAVGFQVRFPAETLSVHGYVDALRNLREIVRVRKALKAQILAERPDAFVGVDAPDFNFGLEKQIRAAGIPAIHYVSPSIWAWRGERIHKIKRSISHMLALFPFEPAIYQAQGVPCTYVGHPLADILPLPGGRPAARERLQVAEGALVFALLPGSRQGELRQMAPTFIETARLLLQRFPTCRFLVPFATRQTRDMFEEALWQADAQELPIALLFGHAHDAIMAADGVLVASGTATLEVALCGRPMVITYKVAPLTYRMMKNKGYMPYVGLPNVLSGRFVVPEFLQHDATPENLAQALGNLVSDREVVARLENHFGAMQRQLSCGSAERAAEAVLACIPR